MSDTQLTIAAASIEIGVALVVLVSFFVGKARRRTAVLLGALTPAIAAMLLLAYSQFVDPTPGSMAGAGWAMGFGAYTLLFIGGVVVSFAPRPVNVRAYLVGLGSVPISLSLLMFV